MYDPQLVQPMREELTRLGFEELHTPESVDEAVTKTPGALLLVVNSVCGCAAGCARPALALALKHAVKPQRLGTVFAGVDREATDRARSHFVGYKPSSPSMAIIKDGQLAWMLERWQIEGRTPEALAATIVEAFEKHAVPAATRA
jgi:putative YphP/YqiW family bacilliredoxin